MHRKQQNLQSTKQQHEVAIDPKAEEEDFFPVLPTPNQQVKEVAYVLLQRKDFCTAYQDLTGRFPVRSSSGNEYILVGYHYDANCILGMPIKSRAASNIVDAWKKLHKIFSRAGVAPDVYVMDNEVSQEEYLD